MKLLGEATGDPSRKSDRRHLTKERSETPQSVCMSGWLVNTINLEWTNCSHVLSSKICHINPLLLVPSAE